MQEFIFCQSDKINHLPYIAIKTNLYYAKIIHPLNGIAIDH